MSSLAPSLISLIEDKARIECESTTLRYSSTYIHQLNEHIEGRLTLSVNEIEEKVNYLAECLTITLDNRLQKLNLLRARLCEGQNFSNVDELSYIKSTTDTFPAAGRLNQIGQALFYASVVVKEDDSALRAVLCEVGAKELDRLNVLRTHQKSGSDLNLRIIGIWDQVRRNERPYYLSQDTFEYYKKARECMIQMFAPRLLVAYELTDRFFADILSRKGSKSLYQVTSALSSVFLEENSDGVLYSTVEGKGEPAVALNPVAVDSKLEHQFACDVNVQKWYGYEFYQYKTLVKTSSIDRKTGNLIW